MSGGKGKPNYCYCGGGESVGSVFTRTGTHGTEQTVLAEATTVHPTTHTYRKPQHVVGRTVPLSLARSPARLLQQALGTRH